jgi:IclR family pca regulon transcriptional regulator
VSREPELELVEGGVLGGRDGAFARVVEGGPRYSVSLAVGFGILLCFSRERPVLGIAEMSDLMGLRGRSTTHRYASTLLALGYLEQDHARRYRLAARAADLALALLESMPLRAVAREPVRELRDAVGYTVGLAIRDGSQMLYTERFHGRRRGQWAVDEGLGVGTRQPLSCTAAGKALLAHLPEEEGESLLKQLPLPRRGPGSITSKKALREQLQRVREEGLALADEELAAGLRAIAAPVRDEEGVVLAAVEIAVPGATFSTARMVDELGPPLREFAQGLVLPCGALVPKPARR